MKTGKLITLVATSLLSACAEPAPLKTLHEMLAEEKPQDRVRTLRNICLIEAEWNKTQMINYRFQHYGAIRGPYTVPYMPDVVRLSDLCWEMTKVYALKYE